MHIMFLINTICNYDCDYCVVKKLGFVEEQFTKLYQYDNLDKDIAYLNTLPDSTIYVTGGEPTLHHRFVDIVDRLITETNHEVFVYSNGTNVVKLLDLIDHERLHIDIAYHSQYDMDDAFLDAVMDLKEHGFDVTVVFIPYPKYEEKFFETVNIMITNHIKYRVSFLITNCNGKIKEYTPEFLGKLKGITESKYYDNVYMDVMGKSCDCNSFVFEDGKLYNTCFNYEYTGEIERRICTYDNCSCCVNDIISGEVTLCDD